MSGLEYFGTILCGLFMGGLVVFIVVVFVCVAIDAIKPSLHKWRCHRESCRLFRNIRKGRIG